MAAAQPALLQRVKISLDVEVVEEVVLASQEMKAIHVTSGDVVVAFASEK